MNGISPFMFKKLTPEQEQRGERISLLFTDVVCALLMIALFFLVKMPFSHGRSPVFLIGAGLFVWHFIRDISK